MTTTRGRLRSDDITANRKGLIGVQSLADYAPRNEAYSVERLAELHQAMEAARQEEVRAAQAFAAARTAAVDAEWAFHEGMLGAKTEVLAQYGADSSAVQRVGLKRKSERRRPVRRTNGTT